MKKWTVMLMPQGQGRSSTLTLCEVHLWGVYAVIVALAFSAAFFYQRNQVISGQTEDLVYANRLLEMEQAKAPEPVPEPAPKTDKDELRQMEARMRAEYDATIQTITAELSDLYNIESRARAITGLEPRTSPTFDPPLAVENGKGSGPSHTGPFPYAVEDEVIRPPHIIYGMARPSADLIMEEIRLRSRSFQELVKDMEIQAERIKCVPAGWPLAGGAGRLTSHFGYRRDPFSRRVRHHDGTDISAAKGTPVRSTANGVVRKAEYMSEYGNTVIIDHSDGLTTLYAHLSALNVSAGDKVQRGDSIGLVGSTGRSTGAHLHYEVHLHGVQVNPSKYLSD